MTKNKTLLYSIVLTALFFTLIFILNILYPIYGDDWAYTKVFGGNGLVVSGISDVLISQYNHYYLWGGRIVVHSIVQFLLMIDVVFIKIINTCAYIIYVYYIYRIANLKNKSSLFTYIFVFLLCFLALPVFPQTVLWITGCGNYVWGILITFPFIYQYYSYYNTELNKEWNRSYLVLFFLYSVVVGWTNENLAVALVIGVFSYFFILKLYKKKIPTWAILGFIGLCIGTIFLIKSPGNLVRVKVVDDMTHFSEKSFFELLKMRILMVRYIYLKVISLFILSCVYVGFSLIYIFNRKNYFDKKKYIGSLFFFLLGYTTIIVMLVTPVFPERATFCSVTFLIIAISILFAEISQYSFRLKIPSITILLIIMSLFFCQRYRSLYIALDDFSKIMNEREQLIVKEKKNGYTDIVFNEPIENIDILATEDFSSDSTYWLNKAYSRYYDLNSVRLELK